MRLVDGDPSKRDSVLSMERSEAERWRYFQMVDQVNEKIRIYKSIPEKDG